MSDLLEHILNGEYASANDLFEDKMVELQEQKLYETKRMIQSEAIGGRTIAQAIKDMQARGLTPRKASDVLGDPRDRPLPPVGSKRKSPVKRKKVSEEQIDEIAVKDIAKGVKKFANLYLRKQKGLNKGAMIAHQMSPEQKAEYKKAHAERRAEIKAGEADAQAADLRKSHGVERPEDKKRPGIIRRNVNTLMGRSPGYVKPETPDNEKGGRGGKVIRRIGKSIGAGLSNIGSQYGE